MEGWVKLHRKMLENPIVCKDSDHMALWVYLLLNATHKPYPALFKGERIELQPGQLIVGRKSLATYLQINEYKVQRVLECFENEQQIAQQTSNKNRVISILSWSKYQIDAQQDAQQLHNNCTSDAQQVHTNKNVRTKEGKKEPKDMVDSDESPAPKSRFIKPTVEEVGAYCTERNNSVDAQKWHDHYTAKGWLVGKTQMKDWKAAVRTWEKKDTVKTGQATNAQVPAAPSETVEDKQRRLQIELFGGVMS